MTSQGFLKPINRWTLGLIITATVVTGATGFYTISRFGQNVQSAATASTVDYAISALGRLEPENEVVSLAPPLTLSGDLVAELRVQEGDRVKKGQIIAVLDSQERLQDAVKQAEQQVRVAEAKLAQVKAGAKTGEIQAQQSTITRLESELAGEIATRRAEVVRWQAEVRTAQAEYNRFQKLYQDNAIAANTLDSKRLAADTTQAQLRQIEANQNRNIDSLQAQLQEAKANLNRIAEVRPVDVQAAQAEVNQAIATWQKAKTELEQAYVRAPLDGQILKIRTRPGAKIEQSGIVDFAQIDRMIAIAEVYQSDISKIKVGQKVTVRGQGFAGELQGEVFQIGLQVSRQNVFSNQPGENLDRRVVEIKIRLTPEDSQRVKGLSNMQVQVAINP